MTTDSSSLRRPLVPMAGDVRQALAERDLLDAYAQRPAYQRNDDLAWIERARSQATRRRRLEQMLDELAMGGVYMNMSHPPSRRG